jgi:hypothetical protein
MMLIHEIDELLEARPFQAFTVCTSDGRALLVKSPEFAWHPPASRTVWIASGRGDSRVHMIDLQSVTQFVISAAQSGRRRKPRGA